MKEVLYIVVPCYNEEEALPETSRQLCAKLKELKESGLISADSRLVFVDDGSKDNTWNMIAQLHQQNPETFCGLKLSRNRGHQNALLAGLIYAKEYADMVVSMDADLQDDIHAVTQMVEKYYAGAEIVYGVRSSRKKDSFFKRTTAQGFYKMMTAMGVDMVYNHADYRLMSARAIRGLEEFQEVNLFLRGIVPLIGYKTDIVYYERGARTAGESKYPLKKMLAFTTEGITSFSTKPIRYITLLGVLIFMVSIVMIITFVIQWSMGKTVAGWPSLICSLWGIGGLLMISMGVVGEYVGKIYLESKHRPKFLIEKELNNSQKRH